MSAKVSIGGLTLKVRDVTIEVSVDEAKELQRQLNNLFGNTWGYRPYSPWIYPAPYYSISNASTNLTAKNLEDGEITSSFTGSSQPKDVSISFK